MKLVSCVYFFAYISNVPSDLLVDLSEHALFPVFVVNAVYFLDQFAAFRHILHFVIYIEQAVQQFRTLVDIYKRIEIIPAYLNCLFKLGSRGFHIVMIKPTVCRRYMNNVDNSISVGYTVWAIL